MFNTFFFKCFYICFPGIQTGVNKFLQTHKLPAISLYGLEKSNKPTASSRNINKPKGNSYLMHIRMSSSETPFHFITNQWHLWDSERGWTSHWTHQRPLKQTLAIEWRWELKSPSKQGWNWDALDIQERASCLLFLTALQVLSR